MLYLSCIAVIQVQMVTPSKMLNLAYCDVAIFLVFGLSPIACY